MIKRTIAFRIRTEVPIFKAFGTFSTQSAHWQPGAAFCVEWAKGGRFDPLPIGKRTS
jgi:hypothetical protein